MVSVFDLEQLQQLLKDFYHIANIRITVFDSDLTELVSYPENCAPFCSIIRSTAEGMQACAQCDRDACRHASKQDTAYIYQCHAGLTEAIMPLWVGSTLVGYLMFGHVFAYEKETDGWKVISRCCQSYPVDMKKLRASLSACPQVSDSYILSAAHILHATASFLVMQRMASLQEDSIAAKLDAYLSENFYHPISSATICHDLGIGRSRLYKLSAQLYGCGISEHIRNLRIKKAKQLLTDHPDLSIADIALICGFSDYNYFISVFSRNTGLSPGVFRKNHLSKNLPVE